MFHPKYKYGVSYYDVAVIKLDEPVSQSLAVRPICLPDQPSEDVDEFQGDLVRLSGNMTINLKAKHCISFFFHDTFCASICFIV